jgi:TolB-like protein/Tfp pilus assembly protein PilF
VWRVRRGTNVNHVDNRANAAISTRPTSPPPATLLRHGVERQTEERQTERPWAKLRRRKVVQWGLAYAAGAWALLQVVGFAADAFAWPAIIKQLALLGLTVGFPIGLTLAWFHGERGQQRVTGPELVVLTVLLLLGGGLLWIYAQRSATTAATADKSAPTSSVTDTRPSIAVLPFENRSRAVDDAFFVDGIHDDILTQLSKVSALRVISRTSVERFRKSDLSAQEIAKQLGVRSILEGGVQRAGDRVRINVQLVDAPTDAPVWAETYDRELIAPNIFAIQSELAAAIAGKLKASLTPAEQARANAIPTQSLEAWEGYQRGRQRLAKRNTAAIREAEGVFRKAIAHDSTFALAWDGLADALILQTYYAGPRKNARLADAEQAVTRALKLEPNLAEGWATAGVIAYQRLELERAEQMLRRAIALNPNYAPAHHWLSMTLTDLGRRREALAMAESAVMLDPLSAVINNWLGNARDRVGRFDDALIAFRQAIDIEPTMALPYWGTGLVYAYGFGRLDRAPPWYEKAAGADPGNPFALAFLAQLYWELGDDTEAGRWLARALAIGQGDAFTNVVAAVLYVDHGDMAAARRHAQVAAGLDPWTLFLLRDDDLRKRDYARARARYAEAFPALFAKELPTFKERDASAAIDLAVVLQHTGEGERAEALLDRSEAYFQTIPRMGTVGSGYSDVRILALRGETAKALAALREAERARCRGFWRYYRDFDPALASIRNEPEFKAIFADIERDVARQRAALAALPKNAPLALTEPGT